MSEQNKYAVTTEHTVESGPKSIVAPSCEVVRMSSITLDVANTGTKGVKIIFENQAGQTATQKWWLSDKAIEYTKKSISQIADKLGVFADLEKGLATIASDEEFVEVVAKVLQGKACSIIFSAEEVYIENKDANDVVTGHNLWMKPVVYPYGFVSSKETHAEHVEKFNNIKPASLIKKGELPKGFESPTTSPQAEVKWS